MPLFNPRAVDRAFDVERYVLDRFPDAQRSGGNLIVTCPRCERPKLWVLVVDRDEVRAPAWQCFSGDCGDRGGGAVSTIRRLEDCDMFTAYEQIAKYAKGNQPIIDLRRLVEDRLAGEIEVWGAEPDLVPLPDEFVPVRADHRRRDLPSYFAERGIGPKKALRYGVGWCESGYYRNRLVVPVTSGGDVAFFVARYMAQRPPLCKARELPCARCGGTDEHKRLKKTLYPKGAKPGRYLFNYDRARHCETIRIVEGVLDAVHVGRSAVATFGTTLSQYQLELLMRTAAREIVIIWDRDPGAKPGKSGYEKALALADRLADLWRVRVVKLPDARDPDEHTREALLEMERAAPALDAAGARRSYVIGRLEHRRSRFDAVVDEMEREDGP
jgi:Toprim domain-containing protein